MSDSHADRVREAFSTQAPAFEDARFNRLFTLDASWLFECLELDGRELLLDVAAGTGHVARTLSGRVRAAVALDATPAMLAAGRASADSEGIRNVIFQQGDATELPFLDETFDVVVSRFALHHVERPDAMLAEMARCLRPGGRLAVADMVADEGAELAQSQNRIERVRDPSHTRALPRSSHSRRGSLSNDDNSPRAGGGGPWVVSRQGHERPVRSLARAPC